jgi:hypothetical protein
MSTYKAYFDGSGSSATHVLAVAGFVARSAQWVEFERNWKEVLIRFDAPPLHMRHFAHSVKEFAGWKGDEDRRRSFLRALVATIKLRVQHSFASAVIIKDYHDICSQYRLRESFSPFALAGCTCIDKIRRWTNRQKIDPAQIDYVFEDGDTDRSDLIRRSREHHQTTPQFQTKNSSPAFQAADLLAYEYLSSNTKIYKTDFGTLDISDMRKPLQGLFLIPNGPNSDDWGIHDKESLPIFCQKIGIAV